MCIFLLHIVMMLQNFIITVNKFFVFAPPINLLSCQTGILVFHHHHQTRANNTTILGRDRIIQNDNIFTQYNNTS